MTAASSTVSRAADIQEAELLAQLPAHLRPFVVTQDYGQYTDEDQNTWRQIMGRLVKQLEPTAHPVYLEGLQRTGISPDHIPSIQEMNASLALLGWQAVMVDGFIPPAIFMEFQARRILVIAQAMRRPDQIEHTPAPDIVHEAAGHAPFIVDVDYSEFLQRFGEVGMRAIHNRHDMATYEAVRRLSTLKETAGANASDVTVAEATLETLSAQDEPLSEAALLARLHWWTVEYGLVGELDDYRIFGAGLLSSPGESKACLDDTRVKKLPLTVNAVRQAYDITRQQPQLFVTKSCKHLSQVLEEFAANMAFKRGGAASLGKAIDAGTVCTAVSDSGMQVSGLFREVLCDAAGNVSYLQTGGPTQLAYRDKEILGHGVDTHPQGFGSPVGLLKNFSRCLSEYTVDELSAHEIALGRVVTLEFLSGVTVSGRLLSVHRQEHRTLLLSFEECLVTDYDGRRLFESAWGRYDMVVGSTIRSVFGGSADPTSYPLYDA